MFDMKKKPSKNKTHNYYEETLDNQGYHDYQVLGGVTSNIDISVREVIDRRGFNPAVGKVFCELDNGQKCSHCNGGYSLSIFQEYYPLYGFIL